MTIRLHNALTTSLALLLAGAFAPRAAASGFQLREQSPSAQGNAFAGVSAKGSDISAMFFNPATMTQFEGFQVVAGFTYVAPKAELNGGSATRASYTGPLAGLAPFGGTTIVGPASTPDAAQNAVLPNLYAMWSVDKDVKLGLSVNAPFGLVTEYGNDFIGRYHALKSDLKVVDVALNLAYRVHPKVSLGASLIYRKVDAELTNAVDFGQIAFLGLAQGGNMATAMNFRPSSTGSPFDGKATIKGGTEVPGYKAGLTYQPMETLTIGLGHQGSTTPRVNGTVRYDYPTIASAPLAGALQAVAAGGRLVNGTASAAVTLPETTSLGLSWDVTPSFNLAFEAARTGWSCFKELRVKFGSGQADSVTEENWRNTNYFALGGAWKYSDTLTFRMGLATDQGAVEDAYRTPRIPDGDRTWIAAGLSYTLSKKLALDFGFSHIMVKDGALEIPAGSYGNANFFRGNLRGTYSSSIEIVALSARYSF